MIDNQFYVAVDEYERGDYFAFASVSIQADQRDSFSDEWRRLQTRIKASLIEMEPSLAIHAQLTGEQLPEIHAVDLIQSLKYYKLDVSKHPEYWTRQFDWLEESLKIIKYFSPIIVHTTGLPPDISGVSDQEALKENIRKFFGDAGVNISESVLKQVVRVQTSKYFNVFPHLVTLLDSWYSNQSATASVLCDQYDDGKLYSALESYETLRQAGRFRSLTSPTFVVSKYEPLIQAADVVCYVCSRFDYNTRASRLDPDHTPDKHAEVFRRWLEEYIAPFMPHTRAFTLHNTQERWQSTSLILSEFLARRVKGSPEVRRFLNHMSQELAQLILQMSGDAAEAASSSNTKAGFESAIDLSETGGSTHEALDGLTENMIDIGRQLLIALDVTEDRPTAMLWTNAFDRWRLLIATRSIRIAGETNRDPVIQRITEIKNLFDPLDEIACATVAPSNIYIFTLASIRHTKADSVEGIRLRDATVDGRKMGDVYVYRLNIQ